jgi:hypothetical protein
MTMLHWLSMRQLMLVGLVGLMVGFGAFLLTAQASQALMPPECRLAVAAGFDPLSGLPHGATIECAQLTGAGGQVPVAQANPMSDALASRRAIPVPLGFAAGGALMLIGLAVRRVRSVFE